MTTLAMRRPKKIQRPWLLICMASAAVVLAGYGGYAHWSAEKQKREAALAYCGAAAYQSWRGRFTDAAQEFERVAAAALLTPRATLAPLVLRMSEAKARTEALTPIPCAAGGAKIVTQAMALRIEAYSRFAIGKEDDGVFKALRKSQADAMAGAQAIEAAALKTVK